MTAKQLPDEMLNDWAVLLDHTNELKAIIESPLCVGVGLEGLGRRVAASLKLDQETVTSVFFALWHLKKFAEARDEMPSAAVAWLQSIVDSRTPADWQEKYRDKLNEAGPTIGQLADGIGDNHPIMIAVKAQTLVYTHQNLYLSAKLITDVRPVFSDDASEIDELVVTHMLTIEHTDGAQRRTALTLAMDQEDIAQLQSQCERAATKILTLKEKLKGHFALVVMPDNLEGE